MSNPTPAEIFRKAREHNITTSEARRVIVAANKVIEARAVLAAAVKEDG